MEVPAQPTQVQVQPQSQPQQPTPPVAKKSSIWPIVLIIAGIIEAIIPTLVIFLVIPSLVRLYDSVHAPYNLVPFYIYYAVIVALSLGQIGLGIYLVKNKNLPENSKAKKMVMPLIVVGGSSLVLTGIMQYISVIMPLYRLAGAIQ